MEMCVFFCLSFACTRTLFTIVMNGCFGIWSNGQDYKVRVLPLNQVRNIFHLLLFDLSLRETYVHGTLVTNQ